MLWTTLVHEFHIFYRNTEWNRKNSDSEVPLTKLRFFFMFVCLHYLIKLLCCLNLCNNNCLCVHQVRAKWSASTASCASAASTTPTLRRCTWRAAATASSTRRKSTRTCRSRSNRPWGCASSTKRSSGDSRWVSCMKRSGDSRSVCCTRSRSGAGLSKRLQS